MDATADNTGGFDDVEKAAKVFVVNELEPLQERFKEINKMVGERVVEFGGYYLN